MQTSLLMMSDGSERVQYNRPGFALFAYRARLSDFPGGRIVRHWHDDFEFVCVYKGHMRCEARDGNIELCAGNGMFINSDQPHAYRAYAGEDCEYFCLVFHPALLGANDYLRENFVRPLSRNDALARMTLRAGMEWQRGVLQCVRAACESMEGDDPAAELSAMSQAFQAAALLTRHMPAPNALAMETDRRALALRRMLDYVEEHYQEKISLRDLAAAAGLSISACCDLFRRHTGQSPGGYVTRYRLERGKELLRNPNLTVAEIARSVVFSSASYFSECFKRYLRVTPLTYRRGGEDHRGREH